MSKPSAIKKEFEKAFVKQFGSIPDSDDPKNYALMIAQYEDWEFGALWAARWMAEKIADKFRQRGTITDSEIRQLAKELDV